MSDLTDAADWLDRTADIYGDDPEIGGDIERLAQVVRSAGSPIRILEVENRDIGESHYYVANTDYDLAVVSLHLLAEEVGLYEKGWSHMLNGYLGDNPDSKDAIQHIIDTDDTSMGRKYPLAFNMLSEIFEYDDDFRLELFTPKVVTNV